MDDGHPQIASRQNHCTEAADSNIVNHCFSSSAPSCIIAVSWPLAIWKFSFQLWTQPFSRSDLCHCIARALHKLKTADALSRQAWRVIECEAHSRDSEISVLRLRVSLTRCLEMLWSAGQEYNVEFSLVDNHLWLYLPKKCWSIGFGRMQVRHLRLKPQM